MSSTEYYKLTELLLFDNQVNEKIEIGGFYSSYPIQVKSLTIHFNHAYEKRNTLVFNHLFQFSPNKNIKPF